MALAQQNSSSPIDTVATSPDTTASATALQEGAATVPIPVKRGRGRPKGSKNKPKTGEKTTGPSAKKPKPASRTQPGSLTVQGVNDILKAHDVMNVTRVSSCLKAGILNGRIKLLKPEDDPENNYGLDQVLVRGECFMSCGTEIVCRIRDILYQPDYGGCDYESGEQASVQCPEEDCVGIYVTNICHGDPNFDTGKFHNHCKACPGFGVCIGDYREVHCNKCGDHYFAGSYGGKCYTCVPNFKYPEFDY